MKKLLFTLMFALISSFTLASRGEIEIINENEVNLEYSFTSLEICDMVEGITHNFPVREFAYICHATVSNGGGITGSGTGYSNTSFEDACANAHANAMENISLNLNP